jgi:hypothetical protein
LEAEIRALWLQREPLYRQVCDIAFAVDRETDDEETDVQAKVLALRAMLRPFLDQP